MDGRIDRWTRLGAPWRAEVPLSCRLTLAWSAVVTRGADVHRAYESSGSTTISEFPSGSRTQNIGGTGPP